MKFHYVLTYSAQPERSGHCFPWGKRRLILRIVLDIDGKHDHSLQEMFDFTYKNGDMKVVH